MIRTMAESLERHPKNSPGPFYVENGQCISCGAPESEANGLISHDDQGHCFFARQPLTTAETNAAIRGVWATCCGAVRYGGDDPEILIRFAEIGISSQCDRQLTVVPQPVVRNCVSFEYDGATRFFSRQTSLRRIIRCLADSMRHRADR